MATKTTNPINKRAFVWLIVVILGCLGVMWRLFYMQYLQYDYYQSKVIDNIQQETMIPAKRGEIYDRNKTPLATNVTTYRLFISPADIQKAKNEKTIATYLSEYLELDYSEVYKKTKRDNKNHKKPSVSLGFSRLFVFF